MLTAIGLDYDPPREGSYSAPVGVPELGGFSGTLLRFAGIVALGAAVVSAPFILHAYATCKPGTIWADGSRCRR